MAFSQQQAATAGELHSKFCHNDKLHRMQFGELKNFYKGLEGVVGPPATDLESGMRAPLPGLSRSRCLWVLAFDSHLPCHPA